MKTLKIIISGFAIIIGVLLIIALFIKNDYAIEKEILISKANSKVFEYLKQLKNQDDFSKWAAMDTGIKKTYHGTDGKVGFISAWESENKHVGSGEQEILKIIDRERIDIEIRFLKPFKSTAISYMTTESVKKNQTKVKWGCSGKINYPMNLILLFINFDKKVGADFDFGLKKIKTIMENKENMELGAFSISLAVKDIHKSKAFYEKLGFTYHGGDIDQNWIILKNGDAVIGLFQGMFEDNIITFNPGWDENSQNLEHFTDVRSIQKALKNKGLTLTREANEATSGPDYISLTDPDGNNILIDQHR